MNMKNKYVRFKWKGMRTPCTVCMFEMWFDLVFSCWPNVWLAHTSPCEDSGDDRAKHLTCFEYFQQYVPPPTFSFPSYLTEKKNEITCDQYSADLRKLPITDMNADDSELFFLLARSSFVRLLHWGLSPYVFAVLYQRKKRISITQQKIKIAFFHSSVFLQKCRMKNCVCWNEAVNLLRRWGEISTQEHVLLTGSDFCVPSQNPILNVPLISTLRFIVVRWGATRATNRFTDFP